jgi:hypothetical protein
MDTLVRLLARHVATAGELEGSHLKTLAEKAQQITGEGIDLTKPD